jgi:hypothetical protein
MFSMPKHLAIALLIFAGQPSITFGQTIIISGKEGDRDLVWEDFTGKVDKSSSFDANTYWNLSFKYDNIQAHGDSVSFDTHIELSFDQTKSWVKEGKKTDSLLIHERNHFLIGKLCALEFQQKVKRQSFTKYLYKSSMLILFRESMDKYGKMQKQYDLETNHSKNKEEQVRWNKQIQDELVRFTKTMG